MFIGLAAKNAIPIVEFARAEGERDAIERSRINGSKAPV
jgi:hypothetical protein